MLAPPLRHRHRKRGQQPVTHAAVECRGHVGQQRLGQLGGQVDLDRANGGSHVDRGVEWPGSDHRIVADGHRLPQFEFGGPLRL